MEWNQIANYQYNESDRSYGFAVNIRAPDSTSNEEPTVRQIAALKSFYQRDFEGITFDQASALLSFREYARACSSIILKNKPSSLGPIITPCLAAYISSDPEMSGWVLTWNQKNFLRGTSSPRVKGSPFFEDMVLFSEWLFDEMSGGSRRIEKDNVQGIFRVKF